MAEVHGGQAGLLSVVAAAAKPAAVPNKGGLTALDKGMIGVAVIAALGLTFAGLVYFRAGWEFNKMPNLAWQVTSGVAGAVALGAGIYLIHRLATRNLGIAAKEEVAAEEKPSGGPQKSVGRDASAAADAAADAAAEDLVKKVLADVCAEVEAEAKVEAQTKVVATELADEIIRRVVNASVKEAKAAKTKAVVTALLDEIIRNVVNTSVKNDKAANASAPTAEALEVAPEKIAAPPQLPKKPSAFRRALNWLTRK